MDKNLRYKALTGSPLKLRISINWRSKSYMWLAACYCLVCSVNTVHSSELIRSVFFKLKVSTLEILEHLLGDSSYLNRLQVPESGDSAS